jgi:hypothetical protein
MRSMVIMVSMLSGYDTLLHVPVSLPRIDCLIDHEQYLEVDDMPPAEIRDLRRLRLQKTPRAPSMRTVVRWALRCQSAEELGQRLRQRYERQQPRRCRRIAHLEAEDRRELDRLLNDALADTQSGRNLSEGKESL